MNISFSSRGSFNRMESFLKSMRNLDIKNLVEPFAKMGVDALRAATPTDSGITAESWDYVINANSNHVIITWVNRNVKNGFPVAVMLQYGHGTGTGGYVQGQDYINPALRPIFDHIADGVWRVVTSS